MSAGESEIRVKKPATALRRGWTTGACATAATKAALTGLLTGEFPDPVEITLPKGETPSFALARERIGADKMMSEVITAICAQHGIAPNVEIEVAIENGAELALQTWNPRLGIIGGLSVLGTTGIVHPFSCAAWIHSIHRGIDVARAEGFPHVLGATGSTSEKTAQAFHGLSDLACLDMGDFAGGLLKYLRVHPVPRLTIAGGFAKLTKLAQGALDLHSGRSQVDMTWLAEQTEAMGAANLKHRILSANTALEVLELTRDQDIDLPDLIAARARKTVLETLRDAPIEVDVMVTDRAGTLLAHAR